MTVRRALAAALLVTSLLSGPALGQVRAYAPPSAAPPGEARVLALKQGRLRGSVADGVAYYYAVPFAAPPVGNLRWRPPTAPPSWTGVRDATKAPPSCQDHEDCLYLNITAPANARPGAKLPVLVWFHGSAFVVGQAIGAFGADTDGREFAKKGVIVVGVDHRLGRAGWFAHPALTREAGLTANYGNMDQIAGLKWVKANIAALGGDPDNVTAVGESAGAMAILAMMVSPEAKGLFQKAVVESGFAREAPMPLTQAEAVGIKLAESAGVKGDGPEAAAALRRLPITALAGRGGFGPDSPGPVMDGKLYRETVMQGFAGGREMKIPLIIGGNSNEASLTRPQASLLETLPADQRRAVLKVFGADEARAVNDWVTVQYITEPDRALARLHVRNGAPTWTYYFSYVPTAEKARKPFGAGHTDEVRYVFGQPRASFAPEDLKLSDAMNAYWTRFMKRGDPDSAGGPAWPRWTNDKEGQLEFGVDGVHVRQHFLKAWRDYVESAVGK